MKMPLFSLLASRFRRDRKGSVAIEFAMLALPFSMLVFAILESGVSYAGGQVLANATDDVARQIRVGQLEIKDHDHLRSVICERIEIMVSPGCPGLGVDLRTFEEFADAADLPIFRPGGGGFDPDGFGHGGAGKKNLLRVFYAWPVMTDFLRYSMATLPDGKTLHYASAIWQNEPFD